MYGYYIQQVMIFLITYNDKKNSIFLIAIGQFLIDLSTKKISSILHFDNKYSDNVIYSKCNKCAKYEAPSPSSLPLVSLPSQLRMRWSVALVIFQLYLTYSHSSVQYITVHFSVVQYIINYHISTSSSMGTRTLQ